MYNDIYRKTYLNVKLKYNYDTQQIKISKFKILKYK